LPSLQDFGYEAGEHYLEIDYQINFSSFINSIDDQKYMNVLKASRDLVETLHTNDKRIDDFLEIIIKIMSSEYKGSYYEKGKLYIK
jgi:hypothetical protein